MNNYEHSKKARRVASVVYLLIMAVILGGTYLSQQQKASAAKAVQESPISSPTPAFIPDTPIRY